MILYIGVCVTSRRFSYSSSVLFYPVIPVLRFSNHTFHSFRTTNPTKMKPSIIAFGLMAVSALAVPMPSMIHLKRAGLIKRAASLEDAATTGYATLNGGTTGGKGGKTVEVSSLADLTNAVKGDDAAIVLITGPIKGSGENVKIGSNKSVIGKDSAVGTALLPIHAVF